MLRATRNPLLFHKEPLLIQLHAAKPPARLHCRPSNRPRPHAAIQHQVFTLRPRFPLSEIRSAHRVTLFCPFSRCNSVLIMKKHPRTADGIRVSHIPSAAIQEYSFTPFILPQVAVREPLNNSLCSVPTRCISRNLPLVKMISAQNSHYLSAFLLLFLKKGRLPPLYQVTESFRPAMASAYKLAQANIAYSRFSFFFRPRYTVFL